MTGVRLRAVVFAFLLLLLFLIFLAASPVAQPPPAPLVSGAIEVRFTRPGLAGPQTLRGGPEAALVEAIDGAERSVDMAIYDLDLASVRLALLRAWRREVNVRLVVESDNLDNPQMHALIAAGIPVVADQRDPLMHDKFTVIDDDEVWTGSMNYTVNDAYYNDNNLIRLLSASAARAYAAEFSEMFDQAGFGALSPAGDERQPDALPAGPIEIYFSPEDGAGRRIVELIEGAEGRVAFLAFTLTSDSIAAALEQRLGGGVEVRGVMDAGQVNSAGSRYEELRQAGIEVRLDGNPDRMHHKVIVIDARTVITGSYNFSRSAEQFNDENVVILHDPNVAARYLEEFERVFALAAP
jgi:phosphatidylserine/phosphatidylglycerophosphate/cardiolipin synthase-like enzyme